MKMNFLFGGKSKNILGRKLSSRYLSSDAFTSSKNRLGRGRGNRLGSIFRTRRSLFEIKYTVMKIIFLFLILIILIYSIPTFRYVIHRFLSTNIPINGSKQKIAFTLAGGEFYVAPKYLTTDKFIANPENRESIFEGDIIVDTFTETPVGIVESIADGVIIRLFSDPGFKNNFYLKSTTVATVPVPTSSTSTPTSTPVATSTESSAEGSTTSEEIATPTVPALPASSPSLSPALFEGSGYGEIVAKLPPQTKDIEVGDLVYVQTLHGPKSIARISRVAEDTTSGSTFTTIFAQLLVSPQSLYKVKVLEK